MVIVRIQEDIASTEELSVKLVGSAARTQPVQDHHSRISLRDRHHHHYVWLHLKD